MLSISSALLSDGKKLLALLIRLQRAVFTEHGFPPLHVDIVEISVKLRDMVLGVHHGGTVCIGTYDRERCFYKPRRDGPAEAVGGVWDNFCMKE